ncbi:hypothetical protein ACFQPA_08255 [Halomarina halobia]|uniref:Uncharacterized protein n=1 Tax=Halomarina halobia TaxID=3033386 RepID=A0ABD6AC64_9EURY|nr:hypothetical protein [Halomarina sp. PSR21]
MARDRYTFTVERVGTGPGGYREAYGFAPSFAVELLPDERYLAYDRFRQQVDDGCSPSHPISTRRRAFTDLFEPGEEVTLAEAERRCAEVDDVLVDLTHWVEGLSLRDPDAAARRGSGQGERG